MEALATTDTENAEKVLDVVSPDLIVHLQSLIETANKRKLKEEIKKLNVADFAIVLGTISEEEFNALFPLIDLNFDFDVLLELPDRLRQQLVHIVGIKRLAKKLPDLDSDDAFFIIDELTDVQQEELLSIIPAAARAGYEKISSYPEESAARLMQQELVAVPSFWKVGDILKHIQNSELIPDEFYEVYIVNPKHKILGSVHLSQVVRSQHSTPLKAIMEKELKVIPATMDQEEVAHLFRKYNLVSAPVEDDSGRIIGMIMADDVVDVIDEEAERDILHLARVGESDLSAPFFETSSRRIGWLCVSLINALMAAFVIDHYKGTIESKGSLAALMTVVAAMGGAAGTQVVAVTVRAYASRIFNTQSPWRALRKETFIGLANAVFFSIILSAIVLFWLGDVRVALILPAALVFNMCWASAGGVLVPMLVSRLGLDPAVSAGPLLAATSDVLGFAVFLGLASFFL